MDYRIKNLLFFWETFLDDTLRVAEEMPGYTDSELRVKIVSLKILEEQERSRSESFLDQHSMSKAKLRRLKRDNPVRTKHDDMLRRASKYYRDRQQIEAILHARMVLKDDQGVVMWMATCTDYFERRNLSICGEKAVEMLKRRYPD